MKSAFIFILFFCFQLLATLAVENSPVASLTFHVISDRQDPVAGATVEVSTFNHREPGEGFGKDVNSTRAENTDKHGFAIVSLPSQTGEVSYRVSDADKFYRDSGMSYRFERHELNKWLPYNPTIEIIYKPKIDPVGMFAKAVSTRIPNNESVSGYDLIAGDWVAPDGKGTVADLWFKLSGYWKAYNDYDTSLVVGFSNASDGIQRFPATAPNRGSVFKSPRQAPQVGYVGRLSIKRLRLPGQESFSWIDETSENSNFFLRIRSVTDENGKIVSAFYGKIYGGFKFAGPSSEGSFLKFVYYVNPSANDRNLEFNPEKNRFEKLSSTEAVIEP